MKNSWIKPALIEIAWLLGSWAFSLAAANKLVGNSEIDTLDIQMHSTYFVLSVTYLAALLFLLLAPGVTGLRVLLARFQNRAANLVLGLLGSIWLLGALAVFATRAMR